MNVAFLNLALFHDRCGANQVICSGCHFDFSVDRGAKATVSTRAFRLVLSAVVDEQNTCPRLGTDAVHIKTRAPMSSLEFSLPPAMALASVSGPS